MHVFTVLVLIRGHTSRFKRLGPWFEWGSVAQTLCLTKYDYSYYENQVNRL